MNEVAASLKPAIIIVLDDDFAVAAVVRVSPSNRLARRPALPRVVLGLTGKLAVTLVEVAADLVAEDAADHRAGKRSGNLAAAFAKLLPIMAPVIAPIAVPPS